MSVKFGVKCGFGVKEVAINEVPYIEKVVVVSISHVELASSKFRVVGEIDAFISKLSSNLVHSLQTAYDKLLQVKLRGNAHEHVKAQIIVVSDKRLCGCSTFMSARWLIVRLRYGK